MDVEKAFEDIFGEVLPVSVNVEVSAAELRDGARREVTYRRRLRAGGLTTETLTVTIPPGIPNGQLLRIAGKGHESPVKTGDLLITLALPVPLKASVPMSRWIWLGVVAAVAVLLRVVVIVVHAEDAELAPLGAPCTQRSDCASFMCWRPPKGGPRVCSERCTSDGDCPAGMVCPGNDGCLPGAFCLDRDVRA